jgi:hypothetical protein
MTLRTSAAVMTVIAAALVAAEFLRPCDQRAVTRDFIVLDGVSCGDQGCIENLLVVDFACDLAGFFQNSVDGGAVDALYFDAVHLEHLFKTDDLAFGLREVRLETVLEALVGRFLDHVGQVLRDLLFRVVDVAQRVHKETVQVLCEKARGFPPVGELRTANSLDGGGFLDILATR